MKTDTSFEKQILGVLKNHLTALGDANDAEDHGYDADAQSIRQAALNGMGTLLQQNSFLTVLFPNLSHDLSTQYILDFGWANYCRVVSTRLEAITSENFTILDPNSCDICSQLKDYEYASQKYGWPENDTSLPSTAAALVVVCELPPVDSRTLHLWQCPRCGNCYLYKTDYEYLVNGTENSQSLTRLSPEQAAHYLAG